MKRVSFKVAKHLKEAGYQQKWSDTEYYYDVNGELKRCDDYEGNNLEDIMYYQRLAIPAPTYLEVWLWMWREWRFKIAFDECFGVCEIYDTAILDYRKNGDIYNFKYTDPEEAIEAAIEYLVENGLIK